MRKVDREAVRRAIQLAKADPAQKQWITEKIRNDGWEDAGLSAAYHYQVETLHLRPWQPPPMWADEDRPRDGHSSAGKVAAWELRRRLLKAGLSMYEPDPVGALEAAAARQRDRVAPSPHNGAKPDTRPPVRDSHDEQAPPLKILAASSE